MKSLSGLARLSWLGIKNKYRQLKRHVNAKIFSSQQQKNGIQTRRWKRRCPFALKTLKSANCSTEKKEDSSFIHSATP